ncbi:MAG TPA: hypothetical protein VMW11_00940 [Candidatus Dormibacteraeota bacterium]|nr:hypothetical protein [Candidatus Dormibacteraeota bacterium]
MTVGDIRIRHARLIVVVAALAASSAILWLSRSYTFYFDEWSFILTAPDWTWVTYLEPHNEHPSMLLRIIYAGLLDTVGLRSYLPYMLVLMALHLANVALLFEVVRRRAGDLIAVAAGMGLLVLGMGWEDILWAFQMAWLASSALGLAALLALQPRSTPARMAVAAGALTASLMFSGIGLVFAIVAALLLLLEPGRRKDLVWLMPTGVALLAWYVAFGRLGTHPNPQPTAANVFLVPQYELWGLSQSAAGLIGENGWIGAPILGMAAVALALTWRRKRPDAVALSLSVGLVAFYAITGLTRAQLGYDQSGSSRYEYIGAVFWLILLADAARAVPWRGTWRPAILACLFLMCFNSGVLLFSFATAKVVVMQRQVADLQALAVERNDPCLKPGGAVDPLVMPVETSPALYYRAIDRYGDPSAGIPVTDQVDFARARLNLVSSGCR